MFSAREIAIDYAYREGGLNLTPTVKPFEPASRDRDMRFHIEDVDLNGYDSFASRNILVILIIIALIIGIILCLRGNKSNELYNLLP